MKQIALALIVAFSFAACSTQTATQAAQSAAAGVWSAELMGGSGDASGFSFTTQFTVGSNGGLDITYFEFLTHNTNSCFPVDGQNEQGTMVLNNVNPSTGQVAGTFKYTVTVSPNVLTLDGTVTGTEVDGTPPLTSGSITGTWSIKGASGCTGTSGTFTMTQGTTSSSTTSSSSST